MAFHYSIANYIVSTWTDYWSVVNWLVICWLMHALPDERKREREQSWCFTRTKEVVKERFMTGRKHGCCLLVARPALLSPAVKAAIIISGG
jgi:hypothetical protein